MDAAFISMLYDSHRAAADLPRKNAVSAFAENTLSLLFPHFSTRTYTSAEELQKALYALHTDLKGLLKPLNGRILPATDSEVADRFLDRLPRVYEQLRMDAQAISAGDPAAQNTDEVILTYPGFYAIAIYRIAHTICGLGVPFIPRMLTEYAHQKTGIDIHPGAKIGNYFCIDHGTGVVIGQTTVIGNHVKLYQGVTLGALSVEKTLAGTKRHPTIEDNVVIYAGATILGGHVTVGAHSIIGGNVWLTESVRPYSKVYHKGQIKVSGQQEEALDFVI